MSVNRLSLRSGVVFAVHCGDPEDQDHVRIKRVTATHVLLESTCDLNGWKPRPLIASLIAEANAMQSLRKLQ